VVGH